MKRLLGLLLVMGMVGCGGGGTSPKSSQAKVDEPSVKSAAADPSVASASVSPKTPADTADATPAPADGVDPVVSLKELGAQIEQDDQGRVVELNLNRTEITDAGLSHLKKLTNLQTLFLKDTKVTDAGIAELQEALPNCEITK